MYGLLYFYGLQMIAGLIAAVVLVTSAKLVNTGKLKEIRKKEYQVRTPNEDVVHSICSEMSLTVRDFLSLMFHTVIPVTGLVIALFIVVVTVINWFTIWGYFNYDFTRKLDREIFGEENDKAKGI